MVIIVLQSVISIGQGNTLTVNITELESDDGVVLIKLSDANEREIRSLKGKIKDGKCTVIIGDLVSGTYALSYIHDANSNGKLDMRTFGPPKEGYGYSNDARGFMGPAKFQDQLFEINSDLSITLITDN